MGKKKKQSKAPVKAKAPVVQEEPEMETQEEEEVAPATKRKAAPKSNGGGSVYKIIEVVGSSERSWEHAAQVAVARASQTLEDLRVAEVVSQDPWLGRG
jgi:flavin-binding protein dodecin